MPLFTIDRSRCNRCGLCINVCPRYLLNADAADSGFPYMPAEKEEQCFDCQQCFTVCPHGAVSIRGLHAHNSIPLAGNLPSKEELETLIKGRRSVRHYADADLDQDLIEHLLDVASHAPTGVNAQLVHFHVIKDRVTMDRFRHECMSALKKVVERGALAEKRSYFADFVRLWDEKGLDTIFRGAPHMVVTSAPAKLPTPETDAIIALATFELYAMACGVGTLWNGLAKWAIRDIEPQLRNILGIPSDHVIGYVMVFGKPAIKFQRTAQRTGAKISYIDY